MSRAAAAGAGGTGLCILTGAPPCTPGTTSSPNLAVRLGLLIAPIAGERKAEISCRHCWQPNPSLRSAFAKILFFPAGISGKTNLDEGSEMSSRIAGNRRQTSKRPP